MGSNALLLDYMYLWTKLNVAGKASDFSACHWVLLIECLSNRNNRSDPCVKNDWMSLHVIKYGKLSIILFIHI